MLRKLAVILIGVTVFIPVRIPLAGAAEQPASGQHRWAAEWIWETTQASTQPNPFEFHSPAYKNLFVYFRKTFDLPDRPDRAVAHVTADSRYKLYVNGRYIGRGPIRSDLVWQYYDDYDIAPYLHPGRNVIAALVHFYGEDTGWYMTRRPGFRFQSDIKNSHGTSVTLRTDSTWKVLRAPGWLQHTPRVSGALGFIEVYDAGKEPNGWNTAEFDDSGWNSARIISSVSGEHPFLTSYIWENLIPRSIPMLLEEEVRPAKVLQVAEVQNLSSPAPTLAHQMAQESPQPLKTCKVEHADSLLGMTGDAMIQSSAYPSSDASNCSAVLVFDFGREVTGYPRITLEGTAGAIVDIGVSEGLADGRVRPTHNGNHISRYTVKDGSQQFETFEWDGFRYMQLTIRNATRPVRLRKVAVNFTSYPVGNRGAFESSDPELNKIWNTSRYSIQLTMHDAYEDCPNREQRQWVGDAYVETKVNYAVFGDTKLAAKYLLQIANSQRSDGMIMPFYPGNDGGADILRVFTIKDFAEHWVSTLWEYYQFTADRQTLQELYPIAVKVMDYFTRYIDENGLVGDVPPWVFGDWVTLDRRGENTIVNALFYNNLLEVSRMAKIQGDPAHEKQYSAMAARIKDAMNQRLWDQRRGVYVDANVNGTLSGRVSQQSNSLALLYDIAAPDKRPRILSYIFDKVRVKLDSPGMEGGTQNPLQKPKFDEEHDVVQAQPFFMHWVDASLAHIGEYNRMVNLIRQLYGNMIDAGATCTWEVWNPHASQCHGWSATPAYDLTHFVLGIRELTPGYREFSVEPHPAGLNSAKGVFPSVQGDITISWTTSASQFDLAVTVPKNTKASVVIPDSGGKKATQLKLNGAVVFEQGKQLAGATVKQEASGTRLLLPGIGRFEILAHY